MRNFENHWKEIKYLDENAGLASVSPHAVEQHMAYMQLKHNFCALNHIICLAIGLYHCTGCQSTKFLASGTR